jgi:hypothetical protein
MTRAQVLRFISSQTLAVQASVSSLDRPQAAVVGFAITDDFEIIFDCLDSTRKVANLRRNPRCALVIGGLVSGDERTVQYEGIADEPAGAELERFKEIYFASFPDGRERQHWPGVIYIRVRPKWLRYSDFNQSPAEVVEFSFE